MGLEFDDFFRAEYDSVRRALVVALADPVLAEEAAQEAFAGALERWSRVGAMDRPAGWVYVAAARSARRRRRTLTADVAPAPAVDHADAVVDSAHVAALLDALPPRQRLAVVLRYLADLPVDQVADAMGCAVGTAKSTIHAALARLRVDAGTPEVTNDAR
jgi:RNA polymerase sigma factor (sigma-70 family)